MLALLVATVLSAEVSVTDGSSSIDPEVEASEVCDILNGSVTQAVLDHGPVSPIATCGAAADRPESDNEVIIPRLTPVVIEILQPLGSKISKTGDTFPIRLADPILIDGQEAVAAGAEGMGEVIHAKKGGGMGAAGELVVTARYLAIDDRQLPLRSMNWAKSGESKVRGVNSLAVASAASPIPIAFVGFFIGGGQVNVTEGTSAFAKTAADFPIRGPFHQSTEAADSQKMDENGDLVSEPGVAPGGGAEERLVEADTHEEEGK